MTSIFIEDVIEQKLNQTVETWISSANSTAAELMGEQFRAAVNSDKSILNLILAAGFLQVISFAAVLYEFYDYYSYCTETDEIKKAQPRVSVNILRTTFRFLVALTIIICILFFGSYYTPTSTVYQDKEVVARKIFENVSQVLNRTSNAINTPTETPEARSFVAGVFSLSAYGFAWSGFAFSVAAVCI
tara:strand:- start:1586 stop:2149 length:564 start_codon:yes stop_codon:yes gene_type:complete